MLDIAELLARDPVVLAPMEDVTDVVFRRAARAVGARLCVTELVGAEQIVADSALARRRAELAPDDRPTAIQIYGADAELLMRAATIAAQAEPAYIDLNCGCWIPKIAARGAGAGWLRDPTAMVAMARRIVDAVALPVTVKTRIGWGPESVMPIVDLARRLEDAGVAAIAIHCRTALVGHAGPADWSYAKRARLAVAIPVVVNGDIRTASDAARALRETGCAGVMVGRAAIEHPWIFREARTLLAGRPVVEATLVERVAMYRGLLVGNCVRRGERVGLGVTRRYLRMLGPLAAFARPRLFAASTLVESLDVLDALDVVETGVVPVEVARASRIAQPNGLSQIDRFAACDRAVVANRSRI